MPAEFSRRSRHALVIRVVASAVFVCAATVGLGSAAAASSATVPPREAFGPTVEAARQQDPERSDLSDPEQIRDETRRVMGEPEFNYEKSWVERFGDWLSEQLDKLFPDTAMPGGTFAGGIGSLVAYLIIALAVVAVIAAIVYVVVKRVRVPKKGDEEPATETTIEHRRSADAWANDAQRHETAGEWKEAIRARYRMLIRTLTDRRQLPDVAGRTTGELRDDLAVTTPSAAEDFDTASLLFELPWYADVATGPAENARFRALAESVLAAPVEDAYDGLSVGSVRAGQDLLQVRT